MMSGIIGRLFREFAVTIAMTIVVSAFVSLTLTPMMASRFLKSHDEERHGRLYKLSERGFVGARATATSAALDFVLRHRFATLLTFIATVAATGLSVRHHPQGLLPAAGHRHHLRHDGGRPGRLVPRDVRAAGAARRDRPGRSRRRHDGDGARRRRRQRGAEQRPHVHHAEAARGARRRRVPGDRAAAAASSPRSQGVARLSAGGAGRDRRRAAPRARSSSTRCRTPISTSSTPGRRRSSTS